MLISPLSQTLWHWREQNILAKNNLDALCKRLGVVAQAAPRSIVSAEILAEVYLAMTGGRKFALDAPGTIKIAEQGPASEQWPAPNGCVSEPTDEEREAH